jgi:hypothetical protein
MLDISTSAAALSSQATAAALHQQLLQMTQVVAQVRQDSNYALAQVGRGSGLGCLSRQAEHQQCRLRTICSAV